MRSTYVIDSSGWNEKEETMPVFILWAVPAAVILAGGTYLIFLK
jgi:hypothetical protein